MFSANSDRNTVVKHSIIPNIEARFVQLHPKTWRAGISMRMELYGCLKGKLAHFLVNCNNVSYYFKRVGKQVVDVVALVH